MPALAITSKADILSLIWSSSITLATASVIVLLILVLRRLWQQYKTKQQKFRRDELSQYMRAALINPKVITERALPHLMRGDEEIICAAALDILRTVRGEDQENVIKLLHTWEIIHYLKRTLKYGSRGKKIQALTILAHFDDKESLSLLTDYIKNQDTYIQLAALRGLALRQAISRLPEIIAHLEKSNQRNVLILADILQRFGGEATKYICDLAKSNALKETRIAAIMSLGLISDLKAIPTLVKLANNDDNEISAQAISSLGEIGDDSAEKLLLSKLKSKSQMVKIQTIQAVGEMGIEKAIPLLNELLSHKNWWIRFRAAEALIQLGGRGILILKSNLDNKGHSGIIAKQLLQERGLIDA